MCLVVRPNNFLGSYSPPRSRPPMTVASAGDYTLAQLTRVPNHPTLVASFESRLQAGEKVNEMWVTGYTWVCMDSGCAMLMGLVSEGDASVGITSGARRAECCDGVVTVLVPRSNNAASGSTRNLLCNQLNQSLPFMFQRTSSSSVSMSLHFGSGCFAVNMFPKSTPPSSYIDSLTL
ncbi:uncharacterized protein STEHIDRAFT_135784 [Stereum hirsutum FP-91666 SS1]|uniref:Uncharacterized protein n=1 Tax=Stereum hirsutum (strain FP-91666) TaxID=721885 RepID=R7RX24_STEHR|nr:uncharacterized protein STEHIDRAFT_135784 [Stereum hirsutum FP-91666 SS1]EIM79405.1 hypothetical protein STEHIDRAFT_135784 [Stereum hirsutum FP-91666 SS1]